MIDVFVGVVACSGLATLIGLAAVQLGTPIWRARPSLAAPVAVLGIGLAMWLQFFVTWLLPEAGPPLAHAVLGLSVVTCVIGRSWRLIGRSAPVALATTGIGLAYLGLTYLWRSDLATFALASTRFVVD